jgi:hypothetical protein
MTADLSSAEPGDVAIVALPISGIVDASGLQIDVGLPYPMFVGKDRIRSIEKSPLKVGDRVKHPKYPAWVGEILAVDGDHGWVKYPGGVYTFTCELAELERAPSNKIG